MYGVSSLHNDLGSYPIIAKKMNNKSWITVKILELLLQILLIYKPQILKWEKKNEEA